MPVGPERRSTQVSRRNQPRIRLLQWMSPRLRAPCRGICLCDPFEFHRVLQTINFQNRTIAPIHWPIQGSTSEDWLGSADVPAGQCAEPPIALGVGGGSPQGCPRSHGQLHAAYACACMSVVPCRAKSKDPRWPAAIVAVAAILLGIAHFWSAPSSPIAIFAVDGTRCDTRGRSTG